MADICKIGETKEIRGKLYRKIDADPGSCSGCAFRRVACPGNGCLTAIEDGGCECYGSIWKLVPTAKATTRVPKANAVKNGSRK